MINQGKTMHLNVLITEIAGSVMWFMIKRLPFVICWLCVKL